MNLNELYLHPKHRKHTEYTCKNVTEMTRSFA